MCRTVSVIILLSWKMIDTPSVANPTAVEPELLLAVERQCSASTHGYFAIIVPRTYRYLASGVGQQSRAVLIQHLAYRNADDNAFFVFHLSLDRRSLQIGVRASWCDTLYLHTLFQQIGQRGSNNYATLVPGNWRSSFTDSHCHSGSWLMGKQSLHTMQEYYYFFFYKGTFKNILISNGCSLRDD